MNTDLNRGRCGRLDWKMRAAAFWAALFLIVLPATAQMTYTYTGGGANGNWSTTGNWSGGAVPVDSSFSALVFNASVTNRTLSQDIATPFQLSTLVITSGPAAAYTINGGGLQIYGLSGSTSNSVVIQAGTGPSSSGSMQTINNDIQMMGDGKILANWASLTLGNIDLNGHAVQLGSSSAGGSSSPTMLRINGVISDSTSKSNNNILFVGPGTGSTNGASVYLGGNNTYTGTSTVWNVTVYAANNNAFGASSTDIGLGAQGGGTTNPSILTVGAVNLNRQFRVASAAAGNATNAVIGGSTADSSTFSGNIILNSTGSTGTMTAQALIVTATNSGRVDVTGNIIREAAAKTEATDSVTKTGAGIVALDGAGNNYRGTTSVSAGVLLVNGTLESGGGAVSVGAGATLGGVGTINRAVTIADNGVLSAGEMSIAQVSSAGLLTLGGDLTLNNASQLNFNLGSLSDRISITGNLILDGVLNVSEDAGFAAGTYRLFDYAGTLTDNGLIVSLANGYTGLIDTSIANQVNLIVSIPEPSALAMLVGGALMLSCPGWRRRQS